MFYNEKKKFRRLSKYQEYESGVSDLEFVYQYDAKEFETIREKNGLDAFGDVNELSTMSAIMHYVNHKLRQASVKKKMSNLQEFSVTEIDKMIERGEEHNFSCWVYATYLTECFLALKIPARMVRCLSGRNGDKECHCVTVAYCGEHNKMVLFDVANNSVYYSKNGIPLDLDEFRQHVVQKKRFYYIQSKEDEKRKLIKYWMKNLIIFQCYEKQRYGNEMDRSNNVVINLLPKNLRVSKNYFSNYGTIPVVITRNSQQFWKI